MSSRFFATGGSDSESSDSEFEENETKPTVAISATTRFLDSDSDEDDSRRSFKALSNEDKIAMKMRNLFAEVKELASDQKYKDLGSKFDELQREISNKRNKDVLDSNDKLNTQLLRVFYVVKGALNADPKKFSKFEKKGFFSVKQKMVNIERNYGAEMKKANDLIEESDEESESDSEPESEEEFESSDEEEAKESEDEGFGSDSDEEFGSDDEPNEVSVSAVETTRTNKWLKKEDDGKKVSKKERKRVKEPKSEKDKPSQQASKEQDAQLGVEQKNEAKKQDTLTEEQIRESLKSMLTSRWRKNVDKSGQITLLKDLLAQTSVEKTRIEIKLLMVDWNLSSTSASYMGSNAWDTSFALFSEVVEFLISNDWCIAVKNDLEFAQAQTDSQSDELTVYILGDLIVMLEKFDDHLLKAQQGIDPRSNEYVSRMKDELAFLKLFERITIYFLRKGLQRELNVVTLKRIEKMYYRHDMFSASPTISFSEVNVGNGSEFQKQLLPTRKSKASDLVDSMTQFLLRNCEEEGILVRATLYSSYNKALHDKYYSARDMLARSIVPTIIGTQPESVQVLFNRTIAQLGLAAFRAGVLRDANFYLGEIYFNGRMRELLAQGTNPRYQDKSIEQENAEKSRQVPFHMQINMDYLEACHLVSAMILEAVNFALEGQSDNTRERAISKPLRRFIDKSMRQPLESSPENQREKILVACKKLSRGEWKGSYDIISAFPVWEEVVEGREEVMTRIEDQMKVVGLKAYLVHNHASFDTLLISTLLDLFELEENVVYSTVSSAIVRKQLRASWKQPEKTLEFRNSASRGLRDLCVSISKKIKYANEQSDRIRESTLNRQEFVSSDWQSQKRQYGGRDQRPKWKQNAARKHQQQQSVKFKN